MPRASDELRAKWGGHDGVGDDKAIDHLVKCGFAFTRGGLIHPPAIYQFHADTEDAIDFLCDEWDYAYDPKIKAHEVESVYAKP